MRTVHALNMVIGCALAFAIYRGLTFVLRDSWKFFGQLHAVIMGGAVGAEPEPQQNSAVGGRPAGSQSSGAPFAQKDGVGSSRLGPDMCCLRATGQVQ